MPELPSRRIKSGLVPSFANRTAADTKPVLSHEVDEQTALLNLVRSVAEKGDTAKLAECVVFGGKAGALAQKLLNELNKRKKPAPKKVDKPTRYKKDVDFSKLDGPAGAGTRGGGKNAPQLEPTLSKKTNIGSTGSKGASGEKSTTDSSGRGKGGKRKKGGKKDKK